MAESPLPVPLRFLAAPAAMVYARVMARRNMAFDRGRGVVELDRTVVSVGNLTLGGTGKTPMVKKIVRALQAAGRSPAIAMRGYGARRGASDEAEEYRAELGEVPVVAQSNRLEGLLQLFATPRGETVDTVVLDDGFQHRRIARQFDLVLVDASRQPLKDRIFPAGTLREPLESLARADAVVITHAESVAGSEVDHLQRELGAISGGIPVSVARHAWASLRVVESGTARAEPLTWLRGRRSTAACAIGNPRAFVEAVRQATGAVVDEFIRPDHDPFAASTVGALVSGLTRSAAAAVVVTAKDWSKLRHVRPELWPCPVVIPELELRFDRGWESLERSILEASVPEDAGDA
ncbi:MAG TPA: tetraacyldisaccharide 4'-kinase [Phycisphaerales bacterium]